MQSIGEVIETSTTEFVAECHALHNPPLFGSFVRVAPSAVRTPSDDPFEEPALPDSAVYAVVAGSRTNAREPGRRPAAYGLDADTLRREQPQILELLVTEFSALVIGYAAAGHFRGVVPPQPVRVHDQVEDCSANEVRLLSDSLEFVRTIVAQPAVAAQDELVAAALRNAAAHRADDPEFLVRAGKEVAILLQRDFGRVDTILRKLVV